MGDTIRCEPSFIATEKATSVQLGQPIDVDNIP